MKSRRRNISEEDRPTISRRNTRSQTEIHRNENALPIPIDLILEIFSRLPKKSIARCRCVSKLWASILGRQDFTDLFLKKSSARPKLLFSGIDKNGWYVFFTSNQLQSPDGNKSVVAKHLFSSTNEIIGHINGFVFLGGMMILESRKKLVKVWVIYNPATGQSIQLPKMKTRRRSCGLHSCFGYDPIEKQFKVLSMTLTLGYDYPIWEEFQVLTLGTREPSWRMIECCIPHYAQHIIDICINGVLYYLASSTPFSKCHMIVCFDFVSEKFSSMKIMGILGTPLPSSTKLINYDGKLGLFVSEFVHGSNSEYIDGSSTSFELWVLEDAEKHEWSKHIYILPSLWKDVIAKTKLCVVGMIGRNVIVLSKVYPDPPSYVFYYNAERKTILRVEIQGMEAVERNIIYTFLNYVENIELIQAV